MYFIIIKNNNQNNDKLENENDGNKNENIKEDNHIQNRNNFTNKINDNDEEKFLENMDPDEWDFAAKRKVSDGDKDLSYKSNLFTNSKTNIDVEWIVPISVIIKRKKNKRYG